MPLEDAALFLGTNSRGKPPVRSSVKEERNNVKKSKFCHALIAVMLGILPGALLTAAEPSPSPPAQQDGMPALEKMAQFLAKTQSFSVTIREGYDAVQDSGQKIEFGAIRKLLVNRPDHLRIDVEKSGGEKNLIIFDGKAISVRNENQKICATAPKEGTLDRLTGRDNHAPVYSCARW